MKREDDFNTRRAHLAGLTEAELEARFWAACERVVDPLIALARENTSPSIERSVLLRMGFSSQEAARIVSQTIEKGLMGKGCGHLVYRLAGLRATDIRTAGLLLADGDGFAELKTSFGGQA